MATLIFKELLDEGLIAPSFKDPMSPEGWFELTDLGLDRGKEKIVMASDVFKTTFGQYSKIKMIGEGGCGFVIEVEDEDGDRFALKQLKPEATKSSKLQRFKNELFFCLRSKHPNIVKVHDHGFSTHDGIDCPFYVMPFFGDTLRSLIRKGISPGDVLPIFNQVMNGVEAAHLKEVVHRDLKPENLLWDTDRQECVVADFGIAHFEKDMLETDVTTKKSDRMANYLYAAPEQRDRKGIVDHRADIFALGLILNEMFTGEVPQGQGHRVIGEYSDDHSYLDEIVEKMIQQDPTQRFTSIDDVKIAILAGEQDQMSRQKLDKLNSIVIPAHEIDDELVRNPIKIVDVDLRGSTYVLKLEPHPNMMWERIFSELDGVEFTSSFSPRHIKISGDELLIEKRLTPVATIKEYSIKYVGITNERYHKQLVVQSKKNEADAIKRVRNQIEQEEERRKFREEFGE